MAVKVDIGEAVLEDSPEAAEPPPEDDSLKFIVVGAVAAFLAGWLFGKGAKR